MAEDDTIYFNFTLQDNRNSVVWNIAEDLNLTNHIIAIKQIVLGAGANPDEYNVVTVHTDEDESKMIPIAILKSGERTICNPGLEFLNSKVTLTMIEGSGPIHVYGHIERHDMDM